MIDHRDITLAVLAGGESSRMGRSKAGLRIGGKPILVYLFERFQWPGPTMLVTGPSKEHPSGWEIFGEEVQDTVGGEGPLRGVLTALTHLQTAWLIVTTVDMPGISAAELNWLSDKLFEHCGNALGVLCRREDRIEPFPSGYRSEARSAIAEQLTSGRRSVAALEKLAGFEVVQTPPTWSDRVWANLNTPGDHETFEANTV